MLRSQRYFMFALLTIAAASRVATIGFGTNIDEGYFLLQGREIVRGYIPIIETHLNKPPLIVWLSAPFFLFSDTPVIGARLLAVLVSVLGIWGTVRLAELWWGGTTAVCVAAWYAGESFSALWGKSVHVSVFLPAMTVWIMVWLEEGLRHWPRNSRRGLDFFIAAGLLLGLAGMMKPTAISLVPILLVRIMMSQPGKHGWYTLISVGCAAALPWIPLVFCYALSGHFAAFWDDTFGVHLRMSEGFDQSSAFRAEEIRAVMGMSPILWLAAFGGGMTALVLRHPFGMVGLLWCLIELIGNGFLLSHVWRHYLLAAVPAASLLAGYLTASLVEAVRPGFCNGAVRLVAITAGLILVFSLLWWPNQNWSYPGLSLRDEAGQSRYIQSKIGGQTIVNFTNPSTLIWTGMELPWTNVRGRRIHIPGLYPMLSRNFMSPDEIETMVEDWRRQDIDGAAILGIHLEPLQTKPELIPIWKFINEDMQLIFETKQRGSYYEEFLLFKKRDEKISLAP